MGKDGKVTRLPGSEGKRPVRQVVPEELDAELERGAAHRFDSRCRLTLDPDLRHMFCKTHECPVEAFDYVWFLAGDWARYRSGLVAAAEKARGARETLLLLEKEEKRLKARVRRVEPADLKAVRLALTRGATAFTKVDEALDALGIGNEDVRRLLWEARSLLDRSARMLRPEARLERTAEESA